MNKHTITQSVNTNSTGSVGCGTELTLLHHPEYTNC
jgi:hypothetical protein